MDERYEAVMEVLGIPFGQERITTQRGWESWWEHADYEQRMEFLKTPEGMQRAMEYAKKQQTAQQGMVSNGNDAL